MIYNFLQRISANFLSKPIISKIFIVGDSNLSKKIIKIGIIRKQLYSTSSKDNIIEEIGLNQKTIIFSSLKEGYEEKKYEFIGAAYASRTRVWSLQINK
jgi:hypothetical protein